MSDKITASLNLFKIVQIFENPDANETHNSKHVFIWNDTAFLREIGVYWVLLCYFGL